jgi:hypothetical protein
MAGVAEAIAAEEDGLVMGQIGRELAPPRRGG